MPSRTPIARYSSLRANSEMLILFENGNEPYHTLPEVELKVQRAFGSRYGFRAAETARDIGCAAHENRIQVYHLFHAKIKHSKIGFYDEPGDITYPRVASRIAEANLEHWAA